MSVKVATSFLVLLFLGGTAFPSVGLSASELQSPAPDEVYLNTTHDLVEDPYFEWCVTQSMRGEGVEVAKIEYLLERIRHSPYRFIRNRTEYPSVRAAKHLFWKYSIGKKRIKTAQEFIQHIATKSLKTGLLYLVKLPDGQQVSVGKILQNELHLLEKTIGMPIVASTASSPQPSVEGFRQTQTPHNPPGTSVQPLDKPLLAR
jgi:hypothetical protein